MSYLIFTGPFRELKHLGFRHLYMYARNYRCWTSYKIGDIGGRSTWIWAKERRLEIQDLYSNSILLLPFIQNDNPELKYGCYCFTLDKHRMELLPEYQNVGFMVYHCGIFTREEIAEYGEAVQKMQDYHCKRYREIRISPEHYKELHDLYKRGWIGVRNEKTGKITQC